MRDGEYEKWLHNRGCGKLYRRNMRFGGGGYPGGEVAPGKGGGFKGTPGDGKKMPGNVLKELSGLCNSPSSVLAGTESRTNFLFLREECENL